MSLEFTTSGLTIDTLNELLISLEAGYKSIYGSDIDVSSNTPDGQKIGIDAKSTQDIEQLILNLYNNLDPDFAQGIFLNVLTKNCGIKRIAGTQSSALVNIVTTQSVTLPSDYSLIDINNNVWSVEKSQVIPIGTTSINFLCTTFGAITAKAGNINEQDTIILGITSVNNPADANVGTDEETDEDLRVRRIKSTEFAANSTIGSIYAQLNNVNGVSDALIDDNDSSKQNIVKDIAPNTIWCVVDGGSDNDVAQAIYRDKTAGCGFKGSTVITIRENTAFANRVNTKLVRFDRVKDIPLYIKLQAKRKDVNIPLDLNAIKNAIAIKSYIINETCIVSALYDFAYMAGNNFYLYDMQASADNVTFINSFINAGYDEKFTIDISNITITEVV